jgi:hypothetical protein
MYLKIVLYCMKYSPWRDDFPFKKLEPVFGSGSDLPYFSTSFKPGLFPVQETLMMIPDCHRRIVAAHAELKQLLDTEVKRF